MQYIPFQQDAIWNMLETLPKLNYTHVLFRLQFYYRLTRTATHLKFPQSLHTRRLAFQLSSNGRTSLQLIILNDLCQHQLHAHSAKHQLKQSALNYKRGTAVQGEEISCMCLPADAPLGTVKSWSSLVDSAANLLSPSGGCGVSATPLHQYSPITLPSAGTRTAPGPCIPKASSWLFPNIWIYIQDTKSQPLSASKDTLPVM